MQLPAKRGPMANVIIKPVAAMLQQSAGKNVWSAWGKALAAGVTREPMVVTGILFGGGALLSTVTYSGPVTIQAQLGLGATGSEVVAAEAEMHLANVNYQVVDAADGTTLIFSIGDCSRVDPFVLAAGAQLSLRTTSRNGSLTFQGSWAAVGHALAKSGVLMDYDATRFERIIRARTRGLSRTRTLPLNLGVGPGAAALVPSGTANLYGAWLKVADGQPYDYEISHIGIESAATSDDVVGQLGYLPRGALPSVQGVYPLTEFATGGRAVITSPFPMLFDLPRSVIVRNGEQLYGRIKQVGAASVTATNINVVAHQF